RFQEWKYLNGKHKKENMHWVAAAPGAWDLGSGNALVARKFKTKSTKPGNPKKVGFRHTFAKRPAVLAQVQGYTEKKPVTDRICKVTKSIMWLVLQQQEKGGSQKRETVGYIAVTQGVTQISDVACEVGRTKVKVTHKPYRLVTAKGSCKIFIEEERSKDKEIKHSPERVGYIALDGGSPIVVADMQTCNDRDTAVVRYLRTLTDLGSFRLEVSAEVAGGHALSGAVIAASQQERPAAVIVSGSEPTVQTCERGSVVTLEAEQSILDGGRMLAFGRWELDGEPMPEGQLTVEVEMTADREAVAIYEAPGE
ncbi:MAG: hypothetical protein KAJ19_16105, partial [Gammaproteobacteria bacterium]|nr:hypothetical protein [Gammaproteobacteria bacterium]